MADWTEAGSANGEMWSGEGTIEGKYTHQKANVGPNKSFIYYLVVAGKGEVGVWGSTVLDTKFEEIPLLSDVRIEFLGREKGKGVQAYKNYKVMYRVPEDTAAPSLQQANAQTDPIDIKDMPEGDASALDFMD